MGQPVKVVQFGLGPIGQGVARLVHDTPALKIVGAIDIDPDILLVDEILAVGDERFQSKCGMVFEQFLKSGKTIIIVSHSMTMLESMAHNIALLSRGQMVFHGDPKQAIAMYRDKSYETALHSAE